MTAPPAAGSPVMASGPHDPALVNDGDAGQKDTRGSWDKEVT
jgi:hypothetical protein